MAEIRKSGDLSDCMQRGLWTCELLEKIREAKSAVKDVRIIEIKFVAVEILSTLVAEFVFFPP
jgi:hypothetical protein